LLEVLDSAEVGIAEEDGEVLEEAGVL